MREIDLSSLPDKAPEYDLRQLLEAGCHFGHHTKKWHPMMAPWIHMEKDQIHIFDLAKTAQQLRLAYNYAYHLGSQGKSLVMVGTKKQAKDIVRTVALEAKMPYIASRWLGGTLTNWEQISKSIRNMIKIEKGLKDGDFAHLTKFERTQLEKQATRLSRFFDGLRDLKSTPDALFVIDPKKEKITITEALANEVPIVALIDSNSDPREVSLPIPANDDAVGSIELIVKAVAAGYVAGRDSKK